MIRNQHITAKRILSVALGTVAALGALAAGPAGVAHAADIQMPAYDFNGDHVPDRWLLDGIPDGIADQVALDVDYDGRADYWFMDDNEDGVVDSTMEDTDEDGVADTPTTVVFGQATLTLSLLMGSGLGSPPADGGMLVMIGSGPQWNSPEAIGTLIVNSTRSGCEPWVLPEGWYCARVS